MASQTSIAIARANAITRIDKAMSTLTQGVGQEYVPLSRQGRDPQTLVNQQLESIANALESIAGTFAQAEVVDALDGSEADTEPVTDTPKRAQKTTDDTPARAKSGSAKGAK